MASNMQHVCPLCGKPEIEENDYYPPGECFGVRNLKCTECGWEFVIQFPRGKNRNVVRNEAAD